jgi:hypothetical protein
MGWLAASRLHGIAKRYAHDLPRFLRDAYSASDVYTCPQLDHAVGALGLPKSYIALAYAAYLPEIAYNEVRTTLPLPMSYEDARSEYFRHIPEGDPSARWNPLTVTSLGYQ